MSSDGSLRTLYPPIEPFETGMLDVGDGQQIYYDVSGNPAGSPVIFVHGGPGGGTYPQQRCLFDPEAYRIILFDQRGCGQSTPSVAEGADLSVNTTSKLVSDMEKLRRHLGISQWLVFGGSWGSTLSLAYAQAHSHRVTGLILRGIFLLRPIELDWFYNPGGASMLYPDAWERYLDPIPQGRRHEDLITVYHDLLHDPDPAIALRAARAWSVWETQTSRLIPDAEEITKSSDARFALAFARIENHYFFHHGFLEHNQLLNNIDLISGIPGIIVQGRYDVVCPMRSAWDLHRAWPEADFHITVDAGHAMSEEGTLSTLIKATDSFRS